MLLPLLLSLSLSFSPSFLLRGVVAAVAVISFACARAHSRVCLSASGCACSEARCRGVLPSRVLELRQEWVMESGTCSCACVRCVGQREMEKCIQECKRYALRHENGRVSGRERECECAVCVHTTIERVNTQKAANR